jgi:hypothetical protein
MDVGRRTLCVVAAGATLFAVGALFHFAVPIIAPTIPKQYEDKGLFRPWTGWTSTYMVFHPFVYGAVFATIYLVLLARGGLAPGWRDGLRYGLGVFFVGSLPVYLLAYASFMVSPGAIASWITQCACQYLAAGVAIGLVAKRAWSPARST